MAVRAHVCSFPSGACLKQNPREQCMQAQHRITRRCCILSWRRLLEDFSALVSFFFTFLAGTKHKTMLEARNGSGTIKAFPRVGVKGKGPVNRGNTGLQNKTFHCEICDVHVNSETQLKQVGGTHCGRGDGRVPRAASLPCPLSALPLPHTPPCPQRRIHPPLHALSHGFTPLYLCVG